MHALRIVQDLIRSRCPQIHAARLRVILAAVSAAIRSRRLVLTELGRALLGAAQVKHNIKRIDRLLGNPHLPAERFALYQALAQRLVGRNREPLVVIDWSDLTADRRWQLLRAALPVGGRCLTLYEEIHPLRRFTHRAVHRAFLARLKALLPEGVRPVLITDAGFHVPWFKAVNRLGWHWIGRIRGRDYLRHESSQAWVGCKTLYAQARPQAQHLGRHELVRSNPIACNLFLVKRPKQHRIRKSIFGAPVRCHQSLKQAQAQREPWLLAVSPLLTHLNAEQIVAAYAQRMQIEEAFRDLKCVRYGLGFSLNLSRSPERLAVLLLIALFSFFALWLIGSHALAHAMQYRYQSNTRRTRPVLSIFNLACQLVRHTADRILASDARLFFLPPPPRHAI